MNRVPTPLALVFIAFLVSGCETFGFGGSGNGSSVPAPGSPDVRGTVQDVDTQARTLTVATDPGSQSSLRNESREVLAYDASTTVEYQGQSYRPEDLEIGDRIEARVDRSGERPLARTITVLSDVSGGSGTPSAAPRDFDGTVRWVDASNRTIELEPQGSDRGSIVVAYDSGTRVEFEGRTYRPEDLERGDQVRVRTRTSGERAVADEIVVTRSVSSATGAAAPKQLRGTVRHIDTAARTIELESVSWAQGFNPDPGGGTATTVAYDASTIVEYQGRRYGIANLEPGDVVDIEVSEASRTPLAERIVVTRSAQDLG